MVQVKIADEGDCEQFQTVAEGVFDNAIRPELVQTFLSDHRHHIAIAIDEGRIVGFASGVDYIHPDKPREMWVNEVGVASEYRRQGIGTAVFRRLLEHAGAIGCSESWVLTDESNRAAVALYTSFDGGNGVRSVSATGEVRYSFQIG
jgi:ribosomal protein S18 acetylase RimI-like enzyme